MDICKGCNTVNEEMHWLQVGDAWRCAYCYNPTISDKQRDRARKKGKNDKRDIKRDQGLKEELSQEG